MEGSSIHYSLPAHLPVADSSELTPFSQEFIQISKQQLIGYTSEIAYWKSMHAREVERGKDKDLKLEAANARIRDLVHRLFGRKSEKKKTHSESQPWDSEPSRPRGQQKGSKGHGRKAQQNLPVIETELDLPAGENACPQCHKPFQLFPGTEDSDFIEIEVKAHTRRYHRKRYTPTCHCENLPGIITAPMPPRLFNRNTLGISVWVEALLDKYLYARPTHRLLQLFSTLNLDIAEGTITDGFKRMQPLFQPLLEAHHKQQMTESLFMGDETRWQVFETLEGKVGHRWYLWVFTSQSVVYYIVAPGRDAGVPIEHFGKLDETNDPAVLVCDRYVAYKKMARELDFFLLAFCWVHVRRDFLEAARSYPEHESWMLSWVEKMGELYHTNKQRVVLWDEEKALHLQSEEFSQQQQRLEFCLSSMAQRRDDCLRDGENLDTVQKKVLTSLKDHWPGLILFADNPQIPMDNNESEQNIRKGVIARNNYFGSGSQWSAQLLATMLTLMQTLLRWNINPRHWLFSYLSCCAENKGQAPDDLSPFLPWKMDEERKQFLSQARPPDT